MNMMLVAVGERTREIGLCKALGAKNSDILLQFLSESVSLCSIGGLLGVGLGIFVGKGMAHLAVRIVKIVPTWPAVFSTQWILMAVSFSAVLGICFLGLKSESSEEDQGQFWTVPCCESHAAVPD